MERYHFYISDKIHNSFMCQDHFTAQTVLQLNGSLQLRVVWKGVSTYTQIPTDAHSLKHTHVFGLGVEQLCVCIQMMCHTESSSLSNGDKKTKGTSGRDKKRAHLLVCVCVCVHNSIKLLISSEVNPISTA